MTRRNSVPTPELVRQLHDLGVEPGTVLLVHTEFSKVRPAAGGPSGFIGALRTVLGPHGVRVMPSMPCDDHLSK